MAVKVSQKTVEQLRKGTKASNLAKAKTASPEMKEALKRFYGAAAVNKAVGGVKTPSVKQTGGTGTKPKSAPSAATRMDKPKTKATGSSTVKSGSVFAPSGKKSTPVERGYEKAYNALKSQGSKPLVDVPAVLGNSKKKAQDKAKTNAAKYAAQQKIAQDKAKKLKK